MLVWTAVGGILLTSLVSLSKGETIELRGGKEIEFSEDLQKGASWGTQFQIVDGNIGFRLSSSEGVIFEGQSETYGSYALTAKTSGTHSFKFFNRDAPGTPAKKISFSLLGNPVESAKKLGPAQNELIELNSALRAVRDEHSFLMERELKHREVAINTNKRVMWWFLIQITVLGAVCYFQISSLKRFFEVRRLV